ncbi:MAG: ELWxxDGT repeat protein [Pirellulales bacterium]
MALQKSRALLLERLESRRCLTAELVADVQTGVSRSYVEKVGEVVFFMASTPEHGSELWRTDGSPTGTYLVKDITPGPADSSVNASTQSNGQLFLSVENQLWIINAITLAARSIQLPYHVASTMVVLDGIVYFSTNRSDTGFELWRSDGTQAGTYLIKDIMPGNSSSFPRNFTIIGNSIFFSAADITINGIPRESLWKTNGTEAGTVRVKSFNFENHYTLTDFASYQQKLYFQALGELWRSDGSEAGTEQFWDIYPGQFQSSPSGFTEFQGELYFAAYNPLTDSGLFKTDGITVTQLTSPTMRGPFTVAELVVSSGNLYMTGGGVQLWKTDGTSLSLIVGAGENFYSLRDLEDVNGTLFFTAENDLSGRELWRSDGTSTGTRMVADILPGKLSSNPNLLAEVNDKLVFVATDKIYGSELWISSNEIGSTQLLADIWPGNHASFRTSWGKFGDPVVLDDKLYFTGLVNVSGSNSTCQNMLSIWGSDGTSEGTAFLNRYPLACKLFAYGDKILMQGVDSNLDVELWASDGTANGTTLLKNINDQTFRSSVPSEFVEFAGQVYFVADDGLNGRELWRTDGTAQGTQLAVDIWPGTASSQPTNLTVHNGSLYFSAINEAGRELWISDGTPAGTRLVKDIHAGSSGSDPHSFLGAEDKLYFVANNGETGDELWVTDGTEANTRLVSDLRPGLSSSTPASLVTAGGNKIFFVADDGSNGTQVWVTTGTSAETLAVTNTLGFGKIAWLASYAGKAVFLVDPGRFGENQVWTSDGTKSGTQIIAQFMGGYLPTFNANDRPVLETSQGIYFAALAKPQLWKTDGSAEGTMLVDTFDTTQPSQLPPRLLAETKCEIYLQAPDSVHGSELWKLSKLRAESIRLIDFIKGQPDRLTFRVLLSQALDGLGTGQFEPNSAGATIDSVTQVNPFTYDVVVTGSNLIGSDIVLGISLKNTDQFENSLGCKLSDRSPEINERYALPIAQNDTLTMVNRFARDFNLKGNDQHPVGDLSGLTIELLDLPPTNVATVSVNIIQFITIQPAPNFAYGSFTFRYRLVDSKLGASLPATVTVGVSKSSKQNPWSWLDVDNNGRISATDALLVINLLNDNSATKIVAEMANGSPYLDTNGDARITPTDALLIINELNSRSGGEGESTDERSSELHWTDELDSWIAELNLDRRMRKGNSFGRV